MGPFIAFKTVKIYLKKLQTLTNKSGKNPYLALYRPLKGPYCPLIVCPELDRCWAVGIWGEGQGGGGRAAGGRRNPVFQANRDDKSY